MSKPWLHDSNERASHKQTGVCFKRIGGIVLVGENKIEFVTRRNQYTRVGPRNLLRHVAVSTLSGLDFAFGKHHNALARPRVHFVVLHSVFPDEEQRFRELLAALSKTHEIIGYSEAVRRLRTGDINKPYISFSFDDGMKNNMRAAKILSEFGATGCFFVCTDIVGQTDVGKILIFCRQRLHAPAVEFLSWENAELLLASGHEIGSHTRGHYNLSTIDGGLLWEELEGARIALEDRLGPVKHFAWPYGRIVDAPVDLVTLVARAGYETCASAVRGCHVSAAGDNGAAVCLRRDNIVAAWPVHHSLFFLARSASQAIEADNTWPWSP